MVFDRRPEYGLLIGATPARANASVEAAARWRHRSFVVFREGHLAAGHRARSIEMAHPGMMQGLAWGASTALGGR